MITIYALAALYVLWIFYLAVMNLVRAKRAGTLSRPALILGYPVLIIGGLINIIINVIPLSIVLAELPREWLVSSRLSRHQAAGGWRGKIAWWVCSNLLDAFDPSGSHCD